MCCICVLKLPITIFTAVTDVSIFSQFAACRFALGSVAEPPAFLSIKIIDVVTAMDIVVVTTFQDLVFIHYTDTRYSKDV